MSEVIATIDYLEIDPSIRVGDRGSYYSRESARAVLIDNAGRIALMHVAREDYYKLPGGGIDEGEGVQEALDRELLEETGATVDIVQALGIIIEWRDFSRFKQISHVFKTTLREQVATPSLTQKELDQGFEVYWARDIDTAINLVERRKNDLNLDIMFMSRRDAAILRAATK